MVRIGAEETPRFQFHPTAPSGSRASGRAPLGTGAETPKQFAPAPASAAPRDPATLKFETQLPPTSRPSLLEQGKTPRDSGGKKVSPPVR